MKQRKKTEKEKPQSTREQWDNFQQPKKVQLGSPKKREKEGDGAKIEEIMAEIFPNFIKIIKHVTKESSEPKAQDTRRKLYQGIS